MRILVFCLVMAFSCDSFAVKVKIRGEGITDDEIANAIRSPRPLSVSKAIDYVKSKYHEDDIEVLDFRNNSITFSGAHKILEFALSLPKLRKLSFHTNRIYDWRGQEAFEAFEKTLMTLLDKPTFETLDIRTNGIANLSWYQGMNSKTINAYKIKWAN